MAIKMEGWGTFDTPREAFKHFREMQKKVNAENNPELAHHVAASRIQYLELLAKPMRETLEKVERVIILNRNGSEEGLNGILKPYIDQGLIYEERNRRGILYKGEKSIPLSIDLACAANRKRFKLTNRTKKHQRRRKAR